jgi:hypothetical protein
VTKPWLGVAAALVLASQAAAGGVFLWDCRRSSGGLVECWREAHEMSGLKALGVGALGFFMGFWTKNPYLDSGGSAAVQQNGRNRSDET